MREIEICEQLLKGSPHVELIVLRMEPNATDSQYLYNENFHKTLDSFFDVWIRNLVGNEPYTQYKEIRKDNPFVRIVIRGKLDDLDFNPLDMNPQLQ